MKNELDLQASIDRLAASVGALAVSIPKIPPATDQSSKVAALDGLTAQVDTMVTQVNAAIPPPVVTP